MRSCRPSESTPGRSREPPSTDTADSLSAFVRSSKELLEWSFDLDVVTTAMIAFGAVTLVVIIGQVERRAAARNREIEATLGSA